jgi:hypothetical protein
MFSDPLRSYEMPDGSTVTIERTFVWCAACREVRWGEELADLAELERELEANHTRELEARIAWRRGRSSGPRCLECASTDIVLLVQSETRSGNDKWTLRQHPGCDGVVTVLAQPVLALNRRWLRYSPEGERRQAYQMFPHKGAVPIDG